MSNEAIIKKTINLFILFCLTFTVQHLYGPNIMLKIINKFLWKANRAIQKHRYGLLLISYITFLDWLTHGYFIDYIFNAAPETDATFYPLHENESFAFLKFPLIATILLLVLTKLWDSLRKKKSS
jgi:hypothetical protein